MSNKKDLTRIEDLGEFIHELNEEDASSEEDFSLDDNELPDLPLAEETLFENDFTLNEEDSQIDAEDHEISFPSEEVAPPFENVEDSIFDTEEINFSDTATTEQNFDSEAFDSPFESSSLETSFEEVVSKEDEAIIDVKEESPVYTPSEEYQAPENFSDLKKFSESSSFTGLATEGNPSFSVLIKNVHFIEDINDIISLLRELALLSDPEEQIKQRLMRGNLLVPRISEYAAVYLAHKLRRFDIDIQIGLSDEIHPPKHQEAPETGIVSKYSLYQNQNHHFHFDDPKLELSQIILAATSSLEGYQVVRYVGVASEHKMLEGHIVEDETSLEVPHHYSELALRLKAHALKAHANAVVGLNYQLTPIPSEFGVGGHKYRLTCTGNLVWVNKL